MFFSHRIYSVYFTKQSLVFLTDAHNTGGCAYTRICTHTNRHTHMHRTLTHLHNWNHAAKITNLAEQIFSSHAQTHTHAQANTHTHMHTHRKITIGQ